MAESWRADKRKTAERGYGGKWQKARRTFLLSHPLCEMCKDGTPSRITAATVVDHRIPHKGDQTLFWDADNWQSLCAPHHNATKQREEKAGHRIGCDANGLPVDPQHHWR